MNKQWTRSLSIFAWVLLICLSFSPKLEAGFTGLGTINQIYGGIVGDGSDPWIMVELNGTTYQNPAGCSIESGTQFYALDPSEPHYADTYALLLTAYMTKSQVELFISETPGNCGGQLGSYPKIFTLRLRP